MVNAYFLMNSEEHDKETGTVKNKYGVILLRGNNVLYISAKFKKE